MTIKLKRKTRKTITIYTRNASDVKRQVIVAKAKQIASLIDAQILEV